MKFFKFKQSLCIYGLNCVKKALFFLLIIFVNIGAKNVLASEDSMASFLTANPEKLDLLESVYTGSHCRFRPKVRPIIGGISVTDMHDPMLGLDLKYHASKNSTRRCHRYCKSIGDCKGYRLQVGEEPGCYLNGEDRLTVDTDPESIYYQIINNANAPSNLQPLYLRLRVHIMRDIELNVADTRLKNTHLTKQGVRYEVLPELNKIFEVANIKFLLESVVNEAVIKGETYNNDIEYLEGTTRNELKQSDPVRLGILHGMMDPKNMTPKEEIGRNLFHLYIFPFLGNTSQGNAMTAYGEHVVVGSWSNKKNKCNEPYQMPLVGADNNGKGSLSRTMAHELGHVLGLKHPPSERGVIMGKEKKDCFHHYQNHQEPTNVIKINIEGTHGQEQKTNCPVRNGSCLMGGSIGYTLSEKEIRTLRSKARRRLRYCN